MHHSCNLKYVIHGGMGRIPLEPKGAIEAVGGLNGPKARGPEPYRRHKDTPKPKNKYRGLGVELWELARKANDGRIWPEAINDDWGNKRAGEGDMAKGPWKTKWGQSAIKDMVCPIGPNLVPG
ncbi:hypothetical protein O181_132281 [Austropuccinia psidii MF-1]|uniref:Uncharacterized protein n=1 Tax=Austropuccinia psidii MF-1 TaxID=1389203 RepID=A0A9Q3QB19_9BASI|nr:hypothetical protein [Austropuccinia psidii MF-1]